MTFLIIFAVYALILALDFKLVAKPHNSSSTERIIYRVLVVAALLTAIPTAFALRLDHVGASLSGLISIFA